LSDDLQLWLIRHGETEWSLSGAHTSRTDIPLTARGEERAEKIRDYLAHRAFSLVLTSPLQRARETCRVAGYSGVAQVEENLREWDYGVFEGRTTADIRKDQPDWSIWDSPVPQGETVEQVAARTQLVIDRATQSGGQVGLATARGPTAGPGNRLGQHSGLRAGNTGHLHLEPVIRS
jgi:broad specificity phosphatase PhoE